MSYKLIKLHTKCNYEKGNTGRKYIVIHYTGNTTDTAKANANYFYSTDRGASAHYFVDNTNVYEVVSPNNTSWAVGVNYGHNNLFGKCTNYNSINIEMCSTNGKISDKTFANTVALARKLMNTYSIPVSRVVRHYDVCSKQCPGWSGWVGNDDSLWKKFKNQLKYNYCVVTKESTLRQKAYVDVICNTSKSIVTIKKGTKVQLVKDLGNGWSQVKYGNKSGYIVNSHLDDKSLSKYNKITLPKGKTYSRVNKGKIQYTKKLDKAREFTVIAVISSGKYKGCKYLYRNLKYYLVR
ncbi:MAG TPA: hypothetical protein DCR76_06580 [Ruminococcaceae bacterium]|nr:hypothetical protein [Oscillospiraceae bacterium]